MIENDAEKLPDQLTIPEGSGQRIASVLGAVRPTGGKAEVGPRLRAGRRNPRTLYLQMGTEPDDTVDLPIGFFIDTAVAELIGDGLTSPWHLNEILDVAQTRDDEPRLNR